MLSLESPDVIRNRNKEKVNKSRGVIYDSDIVMSKMSIKPSTFGSKPARNPKKEQENSRNTAQQAPTRFLKTKKIETKAEPPKLPEPEIQSFSCFKPETDNLGDFGDFDFIKLDFGFMEPIKKIKNKILDFVFGNEEEPKKIESSHKGDHIYV